MHADRETAFSHTSPSRQHNAAASLTELLRRNREHGQGGTYAVCSAHPAVLAAAIKQSAADGSILHVESTSSQVNQFGGYSGLTPMQFADSIRSAAVRLGLAADCVMLGADHLGPFAWRSENSSAAMKKACELAKECVAAGYDKIHLDASMSCADDPNCLPEKIVAERAATLCRAGEEAFQELPSGSSPPVYVIGTEVPAPGGESVDHGAPAVTKPDHLHRTMETFRAAFAEQRLFPAWKRVIAIVVQPGVDFGSDVVFDYDTAKARALCDALSNHAGIVFEAHSTDYQSPHALARMVKDHFAILKVGPWLTFAYREAILALAAIEHELFGNAANRQTSRVADALQAVMLRQPANWKSYYHGDEEEIRRNLIYGLSDRCRYYWNEPEVRQELARLFANLGSTTIPPALISQFLPIEYEAIRAGKLEPVPESMIEHHIRRVLRPYAHACASEST